MTSYLPEAPGRREVYSISLFTTCVEHLYSSNCLPNCRPEQCLQTFGNNQINREGRMRTCYSLFIYFRNLFAPKQIFPSPVSAISKQKQHCGRTKWNLIYERARGISFVISSDPGSYPLISIAHLNASHLPERPKLITKLPPKCFRFHHPVRCGINHSRFHHSISFSHQAQGQVTNIRKQRTHETHQHPIYNVQDIIFWIILTRFILNIYILCECMIRFV